MSNSPTYSILIADDHSILREGMKLMLSEYSDLELIGAASNGDQVLDWMKIRVPDLLISDLSMPGKPVFKVLEEIHSKYPQVKTLIVSMHDTPDYVVQAMKLGISGYLTKYSAKEELMKAIRCILNGENYYSNEIAQVLLKGNLKEDNARARFQHLSKRELEVLKLLAEGLNSKEIGDRLFISERTVSNHRAHILEKTDARNTAELVRLYLSLKSH
jgi:DNA-binding NarL/FixJ family response regulator